MTIYRDQLIDQMNTVRDLENSLAASKMERSGIPLEAFAKCLFKYYTPAEINVMLVNYTVHGANI